MSCTHTIKTKQGHFHCFKLQQWLKRYSTLNIAFKSSKTKNMFLLGSIDWFKSVNKSKYSLGNTLQLFHDPV